MSAVRGARWPTLLTLTGVMCLLAGVGWVLAIRIAQNDPSAADQESSTLGFLLASTGAAVGLLGWLTARSREAALPATAEQVDHAAATLAGAVREQWSDEARARALDDPAPMPVKWRLTSPALMDHPAAIDPEGPVVFAGSSDRIGPLADTFLALPRRRLVITGGPGTGKTSLAIQLLLRLLPEPGRPVAAPVPVLFSLQSWDPAQQTRIQDWLAEQLEQTYPALRAISHDVAAALAAQNRILPILDGLDEVPRDRYGGVIRALNASLPGGVILTSRRAEYRAAIADASDALSGAAVIAPRALTPTEAIDYLHRHLATSAGEWRWALHLLGTGRAAHLAAVADSPLGLWLIRTVYLDTHRDPTPLVDDTFPTAAALRAHLLSQLIPAVTVARPPIPHRRNSPDMLQRPDRQYQPQDLQRWLTTLAEQLRNTNTTDWQWWQLANTTFATRGARATLRIMTGLAIGVAAGLPLSLAFHGSLDLGLPTALLLGITLSTLMASVAAGRSRYLNSEPRHVNGRLSGRKLDLSRRLAEKLLVGLLIGLVIGQLNQYTIGLLTGLLFGLVCGLALGLLDFVSHGGNVNERSASPLRSYRGDRFLAVLRGLTLGLLAGIAAILFGLSFTSGTGQALWPDESPFSNSSPYVPAPYFEPALNLPSAPPSSLYAETPPSLTATPVAQPAAPQAAELPDDQPGVVLPLWLGIGGLGIGLLVALLAGPTSTAWLAFVAAATWNAVGARNKLPPPWRVMPMLNDCYRLGLLRAVGPAYQFRHTQLQDQLAPPRRSPA